MPHPAATLVASTNVPSFNSIPAYNVSIEQTLNDKDAVVLTIIHSEEVNLRPPPIDIILDGALRPTYVGKCSNHGFNLIVNMAPSSPLTMMATNHIFNKEGDFRMDAKIIQTKKDGWGETSFETLQDFPTTFCKKIPQSE